MSGETWNVDEAVRNRYSQAAQQREVSLCCPISYDQKYLEIIPQEVIERDYGCGNPSQYLKPGDTVLDLGSGSGKICFISAQIVGQTGRVIGVDCNEEMLSLARGARQKVADQLGFSNVEFRKGKIQDLRLDLDLLDMHLQQHPVSTSSDWLKVEEHADQLRQQHPLIPDDSIDVVISNCVLNLVSQSSRTELFRELHRVLKRGGRAVISDIVSDEAIPTHLQHDQNLWSGCISGAFREIEFLNAFEAAGFYGLEILERQEQPWAVVEGIEFRSLTLRAWKGKDGPCLDRSQAVIYNGPWKAVLDDDGHQLLRGERMAVCDKTFQIYTREPYSTDIIPVLPAQLIPLEQAKEFSCLGTPLRSPQETKQSDSPLTILPGTNCCSTEDCC